MKQIVLPSGSRRRRTRRAGALLNVFAMMFLMTAARSAGPVAADTIEVPDVCVSAPVAIIAPLFDETPEVGEVLDADYVGRRTAWVKDGSTLPWIGEDDVRFSRRTLDAGVIEIEPGGSAWEVAYVSFTVTSDRFQSVSVTTTSADPFAVFVDGEEQSRSEAWADDPVEESFSADMHTGVHRVLVKTLHRAESSAPWRVSLSVEPAFPDDTRAARAASRTLAHYDDTRYFTTISDVAISPDAKTAAVVLASRGDGFADRRGSLELWDTRSLTQRRTIAGADDPVFSPDSRTLIYINDGVLWAMDLVTGAVRTIAEDAGDASGFTFSPDGRTVYYLQADADAEEDENNVTRYVDLREKIRDWYTTRCVWAVPAAGGGPHKLTATGDHTTNGFALSPDGERIYYSRTVPIETRPFFETQLWRGDLTGGGSTEMLLDVTTGFENFPMNLTVSPDGKRLAFTSTPDIVGNDTPVEHNVYNSDLYVMDLDTRAVTKVTEDFAPSIVERTNTPAVRWFGDRLVFLAVQRSRRAVFEAKPLGRTWEIQEIEAARGDVAFLGNLSLDGHMLSVASSFTEPPAVYLARADRGGPKVLTAPDNAFVADIALGSVESFAFENPSGDMIDGWCLKPPGFDPVRKYPLVVYYYGGVSPRRERFNFAYHWLNANGYVVYALNPTGAYGRGDDFADAHVNDWGTVTSAEIIMGVERFLATYDFVDRNRIGAYGGSYGGFITMDLVTKTDLFSAVCPMFGISNLTSYWGAGEWGWTYGDMAMARSYPWTSPEVFVDKSPVFNADKVSTPVLFLHGAADTNVPPGESHQMFTALKVLGRDAVLVQFAGERHGIAGSHEVLVDSREIMLAWFDKYLKDQPESWDARWEDE